MQSSSDNYDRPPQADKRRSLAEEYLALPDNEPNRELVDAAMLDPKLASLLCNAAREFERLGQVRPVKERIIKRRLRAVQRRVARDQA